MYVLGTKRHEEALCLCLCVVRLVKDFVVKVKGHTTVRVLGTSPAANVHKPHGSADTDSNPAFAAE